MKKGKRKAAMALALILQIGISMLTPILLCIFIGRLLDKWLGTGFITAVFVILGIMAAFRSIFYLTKGFYAEDLKKEEAELKYFEDLKNYSKTHPEAMDQEDLHQEEKDGKRM